MKKSIFNYTFYILLALMVGLASCTKEGPAGPAGSDGTNGTNGEDGINGQDGTATCIECHDNSQVNFGKSLQWGASMHAQGGNFERNATDCGVCHTSQGFLERMAAGSQETAEAVNNPNPPNCYTCHNVHSDYETSDWALTFTEPVALWHPAGNSVNLGTGNLCGNCHQSRIPEPFPVPGGDNVNVTSPYWGGHHSPVANMFAQTGGYEVGDGYGSSFHAGEGNVENTCITCHMATAYGVQSGGHTMNMSYAYHGHDVVNTAGCVACHTDTDALDTKIAETKDEINGLLDELFTVLITQGVMDSAFHAVPQEMTADQAGGVFNFNFVREDKSDGVHNNKYAKTLLENSITSLQ